MLISKKDQLLEIKEHVRDLTETVADIQLNITQLEQEIESESTSEAFIKGNILQITNTYLGLLGT